MPRRSKVPTTAEALRAQGVLLEQLSSQMTMVLEAVTISRTQMDARMTAFEERLSARISVLEEVVRELAAGMTQLRDEVARLRHDFDHRDERVRLDALEVRVATLEARLGIGSR